MRTSIFLDLDGLLVRSYNRTEVEKMVQGETAEFLNDAKFLFNGIISKKRPYVERFLETAVACGEVFLFTAAQPGYAKSVLKAFDLTGHFTKFFSGVYHGPRTIANELRLYGRPWILVDDSPFDHETVQHKLASLGLSAEHAASPALGDKHFFQVTSYQPHREGQENAHDLLSAAETLRDKVKHLEKRAILF